MSEKSRTQVLGIVGSPRRGGNTEILVDQVLSGAAEAGALTQRVILSDLHISPCRACDACKKTGQCAQRDDMPGLFQQMLASQVWVLGTPIYWFGPSAQLKTFVDRWYGWCNAKDALVPDFRGKRIVLTMAMEDPDPNMANYTAGMLTDSVHYLKGEVFATVLAPGVVDRGAVLKHPDVLEAARRAGRGAIET